MRVIVFGGRGAYGQRVLEQLTSAGVEVAAYAVPGTSAAPAPAGDIPLTMRDPLSSRLEDAGIRRVETPPTGRDSPLPEPLAADVAVVACYPSRLPDSWLSRFAGGVCNVHPSPLPRYRGPAPVFWQMRDGVERFGVSVHYVTGELDAGPVLAADWLEAGPGALEERVELRLAAAGGMLAARLLESMRHGRRPPATPQDESRASYQSWPGPAAFVVETGWPVRRAFGFMAGTRRWQRPYRVRCANAELVLTNVQTYEEGQSRPGEWDADGERLRIAFDGGWVVARGQPAAPG